MYRVEATSNAEKALARVPGLRPRVEEMLTGILETADEIRRTRAGAVPIDASPMRVRVGDYIISYSLNLEEGIATVLVVEQARV
jgi:mRNA-degrading endonuclease RelE of RelBE toxin-antitoxin system